MAFHALSQNPKLKIVPWGSGTDEEIAAMIDAYYSEELSYEDISRVWSVGDVRRISLAPIPATSTNTDIGIYTVGESHIAQMIDLVILGLQPLDKALTNPSDYWKNYDPEDDNMNYPIVEVGMLNVLRNDNQMITTGYSTGGYINTSSSTTAAWAGCMRRRWCNSGFWNALPKYLKERTKYVNVPYYDKDDRPSDKTVSDRVYLPSEKELFGSGEENGSRISYYATAANLYKYPKAANSSSANSSVYWTRSKASGRYESNWIEVSNSGSKTSAAASTASALSPMFCL